VPHTPALGTCGTGRDRICAPFPIESSSTFPGTRTTTRPPISSAPRTWPASAGKLRTTAPDAFRISSDPFAGRVAIRAAPTDSGSSTPPAVASCWHGPGRPAHVPWKDGARRRHTVCDTTVRGAPAAHGVEPGSLHLTRELNTVRFPSPWTSPTRCGSGSEPRQQYDTSAAIVSVCGWFSTTWKRRLVTTFPPAAAAHATWSPANDML
jgi:hypothetical protein